MKFICLIIFLFSAPSFAKEISLSEFNKKLQNNFSEVLGSNPQMYEKKSFSRKPASVEFESSESLTEKLDKFDEQIDGQKSW
jgi:hypothetical protein